MKSVNIPIIVTGKGLIPRLGRIAPVLNPFYVTSRELQTIVRTPKDIAHLTVHYVHPDTKQKTIVTTKNIDAIVQQHYDYVHSKIDAKQKEFAARQEKELADIMKEHDEIAMSESYSAVSQEPIELVQMDIIAPPQDETAPKEIQAEKEQETVIEENVADEIGSTVDEESTEDESVEEKPETEENVESTEEQHQHQNQNRNPNYQQYRKNGKGKR